MNVKIYFSLIINNSSNKLSVNDWRVQFKQYKLENMASNRLNGLDGLVMNQGYMSDRNKSPRRGRQQMLFQNQIHINGNNINKLNSGREISPNKIINKNKPLVSNNNVNQQFAPYINPTQPQPPTNPNNKFQIHMGNQLNNHQNQNISNFNTLQHQFSNFSTSNQFNNNLHTKDNNNWRNNSKSPRSPNEINYHIQMQQQSNTKVCENHLNKKAEYMAESDGEIIYYCETCAAKLAAQKFQVVKLPAGNFAIGNGGAMMSNNGYQVGNKNSNNYGPNKHKSNAYNPTPTKPNPLPQRRRQLPSLPQYKNNPVYQSIIQFLRQIYTVQHHHYQTHQQLSQIDSHYQQQLHMVDEFYNQLLQILSKMHEDHVADLRAEHRKHSQMKDIYVNEIYQNLQTIEQIVNDLDENFEAVMSKITNEDIQFFNEALEKNRSNIRFFANQIQQQKDMLNEVTNYKQSRLIQMVNEFEDSLVKLWQEPQTQTGGNYGGNKHRNNSNNYHIGGGFNGNGNGNNKGQPNIGGDRQQSNNPASNNLANINNMPLPNNNNIKAEEQQKLNILQIHQNQPKSALTRDFEGKGACRQIFQDDEDDNLTQQISPKFKNI